MRRDPFSSKVEALRRELEAQAIFNKLCACENPRVDSFLIHQMGEAQWCAAALAAMVQVPRQKTRNRVLEMMLEREASGLRPTQAVQTHLKETHSNA